MPARAEESGRLTDDGRMTEGRRTYEFERKSGQRGKRQNLTHVVQQRAQIRPFICFVVKGRRFSDGEPLRLTARKLGSQLTGSFVKKSCIIDKHILPSVDLHI